MKNDETNHKDPILTSISTYEKQIARLSRLTVLLGIVVVVEVFLIWRFATRPAQVYVIDTEGWAYNTKDYNKRDQAELIAFTRGFMQNLWSYTTDNYEQKLAAAYQVMSKTLAVQVADQWAKSGLIFNLKQADGAIDIDIASILVTRATAPFELTVDAMHVVNPGDIQREYKAKVILTATSRTEGNPFGLTVVGLQTP